MTEPNAPSRRFMALTLCALFLSGIASVANQVVWQRGLKVFLGGSESLSSMVVVLVFMLGLGLGAGLMGRRAAHVRNPMRAFAGIEIGLFALDIGIALLLASDVGEAVFAAERFVTLLGLPIRTVYAVGALVILLPPTMLMGATLPIASEACQRQLGAGRTRLIVILFLLNTLGAVVGAFGSSFYLLPWFGQWVALLVAAGMNLSAGLLLATGSMSAPDALPESPATRSPRDRMRRLRLDEMLGFALGALSLGYEMYLLRLMPLAHKPLPTTFATTLCFYLLFWSIGVFLASYLQARLRAFFVAGAMLIAGMPSVYAYDRFEAGFSIYIGGLVYFLPCIAFGLLYGALVSRSAKSWGYDVGRFYFLNTLGSCLGIVFFTLIGYEIPHDRNAYVIALGMMGLFGVLVASETPPDRLSTRRAAMALQAGCALALCGLVVHGLAEPWSQDAHGRTYWGRDGVVEIRDGGEVWLDGLWHTRLSDGTSHIGDRFSWMMAVAGVLSHSDGPIGKALVVGNGIGLTAGTLAKLPDVDVVAYEINQTLRQVMQDNPVGSLGVMNNPRIEIRWQDARTGLSLDESRYDLIVSAPLHLGQAGSSLLLSVEYLELLASRLNPDGVVVLHSREGFQLQSLLVYRTVRSVFSNVAIMADGRLTVASNASIQLSPRSFAARLSRPNPFYREVAAYERSLRQKGESILRALRPQAMLAEENPLVITDDHPLVEYPEVIAKLVKLPTPAKPAGR
jgi:spermidine synthase